MGNASADGRLPGCCECVADARRLHAVLQRRRTAQDPTGALHTINEAQALLDQYWAWLRDKTTLRQVRDWIEITTPYSDRHDDHLQIYAKRRDGGYLLTDGGYVLADLEQSGCRLDSPERQALLKVTLNGFGVQVTGRAGTPRR